MSTIRKKQENGKRSNGDLTPFLLEIIKQSLESREDVMISGFDKFQVKYKRQRRGRNPAANKELMLPPGRVVTFKCSSKLKDGINK